MQNHLRVKTFTVEVSIAYPPDLLPADDAVSVVCQHIIERCDAVVGIHVPDVTAGEEMDPDEWQVRQSIAMDDVIMPAYAATAPSDAEDAAIARAQGA